MIHKTNLTKAMAMQQKNEFGMLKILSHPHIIKLLDYYENDEVILIIEELCESNLLKVMEQAGHLPEEEALAIIK